MRTFKSLRYLGWYRVHSVIVIGNLQLRKLYVIRESTYPAQIDLIARPKRNYNYTHDQANKLRLEMHWNFATSPNCF